MRPINFSYIYLFYKICHESSEPFLWYICAAAVGRYDFASLWLCLLLPLQDTETLHSGGRGAKCQRVSQPAQLESDTTTLLSARPYTLRSADVCQGGISDSDANWSLTRRSLFLLHSRGVGRGGAMQQPPTSALEAS